MYAVINNVMGTIGTNGVVYECEGHERRLLDCMIPPASPDTSCHYALVNCVPKTQVFVAQTSHDPKYGYYLTVQEGDGNIQVCLQTNRVVTEPLHVHVETTHTNTTGHMPAIGKQIYMFQYFMRNITIHTLKYRVIHMFFFHIHQLIMTTEQLLVLLCCHLMR